MQKHLNIDKLKPLKNNNRNENKDFLMLFWLSEPSKERKIKQHDQPLLSP